jgi:hypothetical protein
MAPFNMPSCNKIKAMVVSMSDNILYNKKGKGLTANAGL